MPAPQTEESSASDQPLTDPDATLTPTDLPTVAVETPAAAETVPLPEQAVASEHSSVAADLAAPPPLPASEVSTTLLPPENDAPSYTVTPAETQTAEPQEIPFP
jgi:hypothetical protein